MGVFASWHKCVRSENNFQESVLSQAFIRLGSERLNLPGHLTIVNTDHKACERPRQLYLAKVTSL